MNNMNIEIKYVDNSYTLSDRNVLHLKNLQ